MVSVFFAYNYFADTEYYIPKPKAKLKIDLPLSSTSIYKTDIFIFEYSNSAIIHPSGNNMEIRYPSYNSSIVFNVKNLIDLDVDIYNFENSISVHEKQGALVDSSFLELPELDKYVCNYDLYGYNIATSSMFYITDMSKYFVRGSLDFNTSINNEIEVQNTIMKLEVLNFINSFKWTNISE